MICDFFIQVFWLHLKMASSTEPFIPCFDVVDKKE